MRASPQTPAQGRLRSPLEVTPANLAAHDSPEEASGRYLASFWAGLACWATADADRSTGA